ncbi:MAG: NAD(P)H-dependent oxidoreductase [Planctomycetes bacterium]|nr:NAD(P)H-dependent oxidoreductase [Planctomycetota bacterium]
MAGPRILAFAGSLRKDSFNKRLVRVAAAGAQNAGARVTVLDLRDLPLPVLDQDLEAAEGLPENAVRLKELFREHDGLLISSPEHNGSISAALKNMLDWVSRPEPDEPPLSCFAGKVAGIMSASPGGLGGLRGLVHVRAILSGIRVIVIPQQVAVGGAADAFDEDGSLHDQARHKSVTGIGATVALMLTKLLD